MKAVLDTNVLVSGMINPAGAPGKLVDLIRAGTLQAVVDDRILAEYADVLQRPGMRPYFSAADAAAILNFLAYNAEQALAAVSIEGLPDPADAPFLEVALVADAPLITGNKRHFPAEKRHGCAVLNPAEFITCYCSPQR